MLANLSNWPSTDSSQNADAANSHAKANLPSKNAETVVPRPGVGTDNRWGPLCCDVDTYYAIDLDSNVIEIKQDGKEILFIGQEYQNGLFMIEEFCQDILKSDELAFGGSEMASDSIKLKRLPLAQHFPYLNHFIGLYTPTKQYSQTVELFFKTCINMQLYYGVIGKDPFSYYKEYEKSGAQIFNEIIFQFRKTANTQKFRKKLSDRFANVARNLGNAKAYVNYLFSAHESLEILRLDISFKNVNILSADTVSADIAHALLKRLLNNIRSNKQFARVVGHFWKRESGLERRVFFHVILFVAAATADHAKKIKEGFQAYWRKIAGEHGVCIDCTGSQNPVRRYGIGKLERLDSEKREQLFQGLAQLFNKDLILPDNTGGKHRAWRCGEWPRNSGAEPQKNGNNPVQAKANGLNPYFNEDEKPGRSNLTASIESTRCPIAPHEFDATIKVNLLIGHVVITGEPVYFQISTNGNPHLIIVGQPGMGKTHCLINLCQQLFQQGIVPVVFSYHPDIDQKLADTVRGGIHTVTYQGLGFNPMEVVANHAHSYLESVDRLRDVFSAIFPDLGEVQLGSLRCALKMSYENLGWSSAGQRGKTPDFGDFLRILRYGEKVDPRMLNRLEELADYGFFDVQAGSPSLLDAIRPTVVQIHSRQSDLLQRAFSTFVLYNVYQGMFRRGPQTRLTHAIVFDEAHRASKLKLIPTMAKECRKFGLSLTLASQEIKDFDQSLFAAVSNSLSLRLLDADATRMARNYGCSYEQAKLFRDQLKQMPKFQALFHREGLTEPVAIQLLA